jgi:hypothetical protein
MSATDAARRVPAASEAPGHFFCRRLLPPKAGRPRKAEKMAQLNLRVPGEIKDRVRILAARDRIEMSQVVIEAIALYEARYGAAPKLEPGRRG